MNPNWLGVFSAALALAAFSFTFYRARKIRLRRRLAMAGLALLLAIPGASFATYYAHLLPEPAWYYQFRSVPGTELAVSFVGVFGGMVASLLPRLLLGIPLFATGAFCFAPIAKPFVAPIPDGVLKDEWRDEVCLQTTASTCGAASLATILQSFGSEVTETELAAEAHSYMGGTEAWYLARAARSRGFRASFDFAPGFAPDADLPALVGVNFGLSGHFIPILKREGDAYVIGDPLKGREVMSQEELLERYEFTGFYMPVSPR